ncbi:MAG TPA: hypothetical protein VNV42_03100 [Solirubrobacteraceae bacterium]|nr:hypothetical protein [Solirubrobacteraceae bacterium]
MATLLACMAGGVAAPVAQAAGFGVEEKNFEAGTCNLSSCTYASVEADHAEAYTQAAGHPPYGITGFEFNSTPAGIGKEPVGNVKRVRVDVPPGLAADPEALPACPVKTFEEDGCPASTQVGRDELTAFVALANLTLSAPVYNLQQPQGLPLEFGIHVSTPVLPLVNEHILLEGHVSWNTDFHEYFEINNISKAIPVVKSELIFEGRAGEGNFLTLPSICSATTTSYLEVESWEGEISRTQTHTPVGVEGCGLVPFGPTAEVHPETAQADEPDGAIAEVKVPQNVGAEEINTADIDDAHVTLPEGLTLNPAAARGLATCTEVQAGLNQVSPGVRPTGPVACPAASKIGTVTIETDLPPGSLTGNVYLGSPAGATITGPPYTIYLDAESALGVSVRLQGQVSANPETGGLEASFAGNPQLPFSDLSIKLDGGAQAPLANPVSCATGRVQALFSPYTGGAQALSATPFAATGCPSPLPFSLSQSISETSHTAGAYTSYTFNLARADGQQYLAGVAATLPAGLLGAIPSVGQCDEADANAGTCPPGSEIGTASIAAGSGPEPYDFSGRVYLTGAYDGAPYGLSIVVPAIAGPFAFGEVVTRAKVNVEPYSGRAVVGASLPRVVQGVPLRLRDIAVTVNRPNFLFNPTSCEGLAANSLLTGFVPGSSALAQQSVASSFQVGECAKLPFTPKFSASTGKTVSRVNGASLEVRVAQAAHQANIREVLTSLPKQLAARITTLRKACPAETFEAGPPPGGCSKEAEVGSATVATPVLPGTLGGPAYLVSHGGEAYPDLDVILGGDGVTVVLVGHTHIAADGVLSSAFETLPDVPISSFALRLPTGAHSLLTANRNADLCGVPAPRAKPKKRAKLKHPMPKKHDAKRKQRAKPATQPAQLAMPTTIVAQSGAKLVQTTKIAVAGCPRHRKSTRHRRRPLQSGGHGHHRHRRPVSRERVHQRRGR